jgi:hypothetical protein
MLMLCSTDSSLAGSAARRVAAELADRCRVGLCGLDVGDPSRWLLAAAHATGCDVLVVGYTLRSGLEIASTPGWQRRVVRDTPCPFMLVPAGASPLRRGGLMLGCGAWELPREAAMTARSLAGRLQTPLILTDVLAGDGARRPTDRPLHGAFRVPADEAAVAVGRTAHARPVRCDQHLSGENARPAMIQEAALVAIAGRYRGRGLLPRRNIGQGMLHASNGLPAIVAVMPTGRRRLVGEAGS